ncbi:pilus assembly protein [Bifidobacterium ramosum]|uniref:Pilus assembly protein n=1 Tax=Bifidobacterium ramosum TaxID=1798158 RepID=A0A6L4WY11_9BIFI|nr:pilus assembly protein [Bifidobacterium ramosum]
MWYGLLAACCTGAAVALARDDVPRRRLVDADRRWLCGAAAGRISVTTVLSLTAVALRQGASIPYALDAVGKSIGDDDDGVGTGLCRVADALRRGNEWNAAWRAGMAAVTAVDVVTVGAKYCTRGHGAHSGAALHIAADDAWRRRVFDMLRHALESSWTRGAPPVTRLEAALDQCDADERSRIEEHAARLSVRLLIPTGLCFLPAFILIGIIPSIASFMP